MGSRPVVYGSPVRWIVPAVVGVVVLLVAVAAGAVVLARGGGDQGAPAPGRTPRVTPTSSAWLPTTTPEEVVQSFLTAVKTGNCAQQQFYVTRELLASSGSCTASSASPQMRWTISDATIDLVDRTATVPFEVSDVGSQEGRIFGLVLSGGQWRIDNFRAEATHTPTPTASAPTTRVQ